MANNSLYHCKSLHRREIDTYTDKTVQNSQQCNMPLYYPFKYILMCLRLTFLYIHGGKGSLQCYASDIYCLHVATLTSSQLLKRMLQFTKHLSLFISTELLSPPGGV